MWELLKLDPKLSTKQPFGAPDFVVALAGSAGCTQRTTTRLERRLNLLRGQGPTICGKCLAAKNEHFLSVPPHLRGVLVAELHVLCRLRGERPRLTTADELVAYLGESCPGLLDALALEWYYQKKPGSPKELRPEYAKGKDPWEWLER